MAEHRSLKKIFLLCLSAALCFSCTACAEKDFTKENSKENEDMYAAAPSIKNHPVELAKDFLINIQTNKYKEAYALLDVDAKIGLSLQRFEQEMGRYMASASTRSSYATRIVSGESIIGKTALVTVEDYKYPTSPVWTWEFKNTRAGWKISSLDLPPVSRYQPKQSYTSSSHKTKKRRHRRRRS